MQGAELLRLVDAIHRERNIDKELLFQGLEHALLTAARKKLGETASISVMIDRETGDVRVIGPEGEMELQDLGRISAQTAKQVYGQIIREAEREVIFSEYDRFQRALVTGTVYRLDGTAVIVSLGRTEGYLPKHEQVRGETYRVGERVLCYVVEVKKIGNRVKIILSRSHPEMIRRLFEREIPEVADGVVDIVQLVREAGYKTKVACRSLDPKVDPIGACVGVRGARIKNIIDELGGEKIDIIRWNESPEVLIVNALKPAQINSITLYEDVKKALVVVDEDQLSLAIGKKGANVRLAAKLSGWDIDIMSEHEAREQGVFDEPAMASQVELAESGEVVSEAVLPTSTPAPAEPPAEAPADPPADAPSEAAAEAPAAESTDDAEDATEETPLPEETVVDETLVEETVVDETAVEEPAVAEEPEKPVEEPAGEPAEELSVEPVEKPAAELSAEPSGEPAAAPASELVEKSVPAAEGTQPEA